jgi:hypothetical protein
VNTNFSCCEVERFESCSYTSDKANFPFANRVSKLDSVLSRPSDEGNTTSICRIEPFGHLLGEMK